MEIINYNESSFCVDDLKKFFKLNDHLFPDPFSKHVNQDVYMEKLINNGEILLAIVDSQIAGIACVYANDYETYIAHLQMLLVGKAYQSCGIGRALTLEILDIVRIKGMKKCMLTVDKENFKAEKLYKSIGYIDSIEKNEKENKKFMEYILGGE